MSQDRTLETAQALADTLPAAQRYATDGHSAYTELVWTAGWQYLLSRGKEETPTVESLNTNLRTYLARPAWRSRCFGRLLEALRQAMCLPICDYNQRQRLYLAILGYEGICRCCISHSCIY